MVEGRATGNLDIGGFASVRPVVDGVVDEGIVVEGVAFFWEDIVEGQEEYGRSWGKGERGGRRERRRGHVWRIDVRLLRLSSRSLQRRRRE